MAGRRSEAAAVFPPRAIIVAWLDTFPNADAAIAGLSAARVPAAPVLSPREVTAHPHLAEREFFPVSWLDQHCEDGSRLDAAGGPLGNRYVLEVSSPGIDRPVRWHRHWVQFVGRDVSVKLAGLGRVRARIVAVLSEDSVVLQPEGGAEREFRLSDVKDARLASDADKDS